MELDIRMVAVHEFIRADIAGAIDVPTTRGVLHEILQSSRKVGVSRVLIDARGVDSQAIGHGDISEILAYMSLIGYASDHRVAIMAGPGDAFDKAQIAEESSREQGLTIGAFGDFESALTWLEGRSL